MSGMGGEILHHQVFGEGDRAVILCHGLYGQSSNLAPIARELALDYRAVAVDMRNHGRSFHSTHMDYPAMAGDILRLMDHLGLESAVLLGHSMGGKAVMEAALTAPGRVRELIVADIAPVRYDRHHNAVFAALTEADQPQIDRRAAQVILEKHIDEPAVVSFLLMNRQRDDEGHWRWRFNLDALIDSYEQILAEPTAPGPYGGPTLFIKGELSEYILPSHAHFTQTLFPAASLKVIAGTGHWLHAEKPTLFRRIVREALLKAF